MSTIKTNQIQTVAGKLILGSTGSLLNVAQYITTATTLYSGSVDVYQTITDMNYTYTPVGSGSKIIIHWECRIGFPNNHSQNVKLLVNGTGAYLGSGGSDQSSSQSLYVTNTSAMIDSFDGTYIFQNTGTSSVSLGLQGASQNGVFYLNRGYSYDDSSRKRPPSSWLIMEVSA